MEQVPLNKDDQSSQSTEKPHWSTWKPGFWRRFPKTGMLALFLTVFASGSMIYIIRHSDGQPIGSWKYQPTVCLAISYTVANIALQYALAQAVIIAWWAKALKGDARIRDLHNIWSFGHGFWSILTSGRSFNLIALAGLTVTLVPINGPLLQRASVIHQQTRVETKYINISIAQEFPGGYTGEISGRGIHTPNSLSPSFSNIVKQHATQLPMNITKSGCSGTCKGILYGAGYAMECTHSTTDPYDIQLDQDEVMAYMDYINSHPNSSTNSSTFFRGGEYRNVLMYSFFSTNFTYMDEFSISSLVSAGFATNVTNVMNLTAVFKGEATCAGALNLTHCLLHPATIGYPIVMTNDTITLDPAGSWKTDEAHGFHPPMLNGYFGPTTHGGLYLYANELYKSSMGTMYDGGVGWRGSTSGTTGYRYIESSSGENNHDIQGGCDIRYKDPTPDILDTVRELAFRTALYIPGDERVVSASKKKREDEDLPSPLSQDQRDAAFLRSMEVEESRPEVVYKSQYIYLAIAVGVTLLATFCVCVILEGWWHLGRNVSLSPIEIAKAFQAPLLEESSPNASARTLLGSCGSRKVRYGAVWQGGRDVPSLKFEGVDGCEKPRKGQVFG